MALEQKTALRKDAIGLIGAATLGVVMLSPAMTLYGGFGPAFLTAGKAAPLAFVWALAATIPTAISYTLLSREHPESGSAASWARMVFPASFARWAGWMAFLYYLTNFVIQPVTLGVFFSDFLKGVGLPSGAWAFYAGVLLCCSWPAWIVYRGISVSTRGALAFLLFECAVVVALCAAVVSNASSTGVHLSMEGFSLASSPSGSSGIFRAMIFSMLAYCGFDVVSTLSEETKLARKLIPQATLLSLFIYSGFIIVGIWCLTYGETSENLKAAAESGQMPIQLVASRVWGHGATLVALTAISASLGLAIATAVGSSRILYWMGREGIAPKTFGELRMAIHLVFGVGLLGSVLAGIALGPYQAYVWWCSTSTFFAMLTYLFVNSSCMLLYRERAKSGFGSAILYLFVPALGFAADLWILIRSFFVELWGQDWLTGKSILAFDCGIALLLAFVAIRPSSYRRVEVPRATT